MKKGEEEKESVIESVKKETKSKREQERIIYNKSYYRYRGQRRETLVFGIYVESRVKERKKERKRKEERQ